MQKIRVLKDVVLDIGDGLGSSVRRSGEELQFASDEYFEKGNYAERIAKLSTHIMFINEQEPEIDDDEEQETNFDEDQEDDIQDFDNEEEEVADDLEELTIPELKALCDNVGIDYLSKTTKPELIEKVKALLESEE